MVRKLIKKIFGIKGIEDIQEECFVKPNTRGVELRATQTNLKTV